METKVVDGATLEELLPVADAVDALEAAFRDGPMPDAPLRSCLPVAGSDGDGELLLMPVAGAGVAGVKLLTVVPSNPGCGFPLIQGVYVLFSGAALAPAAVFDGAALTGVRTAAVSALATRHLAPQGARRLVLFGAGAQAEAHLGAMCAVRPVEEVFIVDSSPERALRLAEMARATGLDASVAGPEAVAEADLICTCTTSPKPVLNGALLKGGAHVNAVGAYKPDRRELDTETVARARVVVEARDVAFEEAGDLLIPIEEGRIGKDHIVADLGELLRGKAVRQRSEDVTVFESVGMAYEDLIIARAATERMSS